MKIAIVTSNDNFCKGVVRELDRRGCEVLLYRPYADDRINLYQLGQLSALADATFVDFAQHPCEIVLKEFQRRVVVRAHRLEMYAEDVPTWAWQNCDCLLFVADHVRERFLSRLTAQPKTWEVLPHVGIDVGLFAYCEREFAPPWRILMVGNVIPKKRQYTALQMLADLPGDVHLWLAGAQGTPAGYGNGEYGANLADLREILGLGERVLYRGPIPHAEVPGMMGQCHFVLSASNEEGCHTTVAEGMATGLAPLVNCWRGADALYGAEAIWRTPKELYRKVEAWIELSVEDKAALALECSEFAQQFDGRVIDARIADILMGEAGVAEEYDKHVPHQLEQYGNPRQQRCLQLLLGHSAEGDSVLDVGCGLGYVVSQATWLGRAAVGLDISPGLLQQARYRACPQARWLVGDATINFPIGPWACIAFFDSLEHIPSESRQALVVAARDNLRPGGHLIITFPWGGGDKGQRYEWPVRPKTLSQWLRKIGLSEVHDGPLDDEYWGMVWKWEGEGAVPVVEMQLLQPAALGALGPTDFPLETTTAPAMIGALGPADEVS